MTSYLNAHRYQYATGQSTRTRRQGCTWSSAACGADASTGGRVNLTPDQVLAQVKPSEETNPITPGWSLTDTALAMSRLGVPFAVRSGQRWTNVEAVLNAGYGVLLQGDSDQFSDATCSGAFDGDHAIFLHPEQDAQGRQRIDDSICKAHRYETRANLRKYAEKFGARVSGRTGGVVYFGVFTTSVPTQESDMGVTFTVLDWVSGAVVVTGDNHDLISLSDNSRTPIAAGSRKGTGARIKLVSGAGRQDGLEAYMVNQSPEPSARALLANDVTFEPAPTEELPPTVLVGTTVYRR